MGLRAILLLAGLMCFAGRSKAMAALELNPATPRVEAYAALLSYKDDSQKMDLESVRRKYEEGAFTQESGKVPSYGVTSSDFWFALTVHAKPQGDERWFIAVEYPNLDWLDVYFVLSDGRVIEKHSGDRRSFAHRDFQSRNFYFEIPFQITPDSIEVFIRARASGAMIIPLYIQELKDVIKKDHDSQLYFGFIIGAVFIMAVSYLLIGLQARNLEHIYLGLCFGIGAFCRMTYQGLVFEYLFPNAPKAPNVLILTTGVLGLQFMALFSARFLELHKHRRWYLLYRGYLVLLFTTLVLVLVFEYKFIKLLSGLAIVAPFLWIVCGSYVWISGFKPARFFVASWSLVALSLLIFNLMTFGLVPKSILISNSIEISMVIQLVFLTFAVGEKINVMNLAAKRAQQKALEAQIETRRASEEMNTRLEKEVQARTQDLWKQTQEMQIILDNVQQGICTIDENFFVKPRHSKQLARFVDIQDHQSVSLLTSFFDKTTMPSDAIQSMKSAFQSFFGSERWTFELNSQLLPRKVELDIQDSKAHLELDWAPIDGPDGLIAAILLTVKDVTDLRKIESAAHSQKRELEIVGRIMRVPSIKVDIFLENAEELLARCHLQLSNRLDIQSWVELLRSLHTIKGNARTYRFYDISSTLHECEDRLSHFKSSLQVDSTDQIGPDVLREVRDIVQEYRDIQDKVLNRSEIVRIVKTFGHFSESLLSIWLRIPPDDRRVLLPNLETLNSLLLHGFYKILDPVIASLGELSKQLMKVCPKVRIDGDDFFIKYEDINKFESVFMHMFRNSLDHGFPSDFDGEISVHIHHDEGKTSIDYFDNGRGLAIDILREKASQNALIPRDADEQLVSETIFLPGLSSAIKVTDISGRGIGMSAVRQLIENLGGTIGIQLKGPGSTPGYRYFNFRIELPRYQDRKSWSDVDPENSPAKS